MRLKDISESTSDLFNLPVDALEVDPAFNVREDSEALREHIRGLAADMMANGFLRSKPLTVRLSGDRAIVVDGHCRLAAVRLAISDGAEIRTLPCLPEAKGTSEAERSVMLIKSNAGLPLTALEQSVVIKRLLSFGWSEGQIALKLGRSRQHVNNLLELASAPEAVRTMIVDGVVSATEAIKVCRTEGDAAPRILSDAAKRAAASGKRKVTASTLQSVCKPLRREAVQVFLSEWDKWSPGREVSARLKDAIEALREMVP